MNEPIERKVSAIKAARIVDRDGCIIESIDPAASEVELDSGEIVTAETLDLYSEWGAVDSPHASIRRMWAWN